MIKIYEELEQGSEAWHEIRCGLLTASEMKLVITPTLKVADNEKTKTHLYELAAQRVTGYTEPHYIGDEMLRGKEDEIFARAAYEEHYAPVTEVGFITNDKWGFTLGYSPDGLIGDDGKIEIKSRRQKYQLQTIVENEMPSDYMLQVQTGLLISEREWCDFITYSAGMPMLTLRVYPDKAVQDAIVTAATVFHGKLDAMVQAYKDRLADTNNRLIPTERRIEMEITL